MKIHSPFRKPFFRGIILFIVLAGLLMPAALVFGQEQPPLYLPLVLRDYPPPPTPTPKPLLPPLSTPTNTPEITFSPQSFLFLPLISRYDLPPAPPYATSIYIQNPTDPELFNLGCAQGQRDQNLPGQQDNLVVLAFGKMWKVGNEYYLRTYTNPSTGTRTNLTFKRVEELAQQYLLGYRWCSDGISLLALGIGSNNYDDMNIDNDINKFSADQAALRQTAYAFGQRFADTTYNLNEWIRASGYASRLWVMGALDIEWAGRESDGRYWWNTPYVTGGWVEGFNANSRGREMYLNYGACVGCPITPSLSWVFSTTRDANNVVMDWSQGDVYYVSWGAPPALPLPEIYRNDGYLARQWQAVSLYGALYKGGKMTFAGAMTQFQSCQQKKSAECATLDNTPDEGWSQLYDWLNQDPRTAQQVLRWVTDIRWQIR
ncbi:hypothetical protein BECAL_00568 [Bellilinea caldifistulae]|uniref:hypothetical protein n=1 Tax=Bellilinea caldifistulae TaxID=360411 RepID=UPI0011AEBA92|nr:hypothetical protein [Bellilinea caldifistulae]GAP09424.1 hypothetical protein BECAL_00568 [Bellilinea caldifistulae]